MLILFVAYLTLAKITMKVKVTHHIIRYLLTPHPYHSKRLRIQTDNNVDDNNANGLTILLFLPKTKTNPKKPWAKITHTLPPHSQTKWVFEVHVARICEWLVYMTGTRCIFCWCACKIPCVCSQHHSWADLLYIISGCLKFIQGKYVGITICWYYVS